MATLSYEILKRRQKSYIKAYAVLCAVILVSMGFYTFQKWRAYSAAQVLMAKNEQFIEVLKERASLEKKDYESHKDDFQKLQEEVGTKLTDIFPADDHYTQLTRQLDSFEEQISKKNSPFEISNISYMSPQFTETYSLLPVRMTIRSSRENFTEFLHLVENSGSLDENIRLMDISSIRLNFQDGATDNASLINFTVHINAYFRAQS